MDPVRIEIDGDLKVGLRFAAFPNEMRGALKAEIESITAELFGMVQAATPEKTGRLRSQEGSRVWDDPNKIAGKVFVDDDGAQDAIKAADLEYGGTGITIDVKPHEMSLDHVFDKMLAAPEMKMREYLKGRKSNVAAHSFLRGPLERMQPEIIARLNAVVETATKTVDG
jgi:hypothetical protein